MALKLPLLPPSVLLTACVTAPQPGDWQVIERDSTPTAPSVALECNSPGAQLICDLNDERLYDLAVAACGELGFPDAQHFQTRIDRPRGNTLAGVHVMRYACVPD